MFYGLIPDLQHVVLDSDSGLIYLGLQHTLQYTVQKCPGTHVASCASPFTKSPGMKAGVGREQVWKYEVTRLWRSWQAFFNSWAGRGLVEGAVHGV